VIKVTVGELKEDLNKYDDSLNVKYKDDKGIKLSDICKVEQISDTEIQLFSKGGY
jgi:hypothetical protein